MMNCFKIGYQNKTKYKTAPSRNAKKPQIGVKQESPRYERCLKAGRSKTEDDHIYRLMAKSFNIHTPQKTKVKIPIPIAAMVVKMICFRWGRFPFICWGNAKNKRWKQLILSRGRSFIFSTNAPVPVIAAGHAAVLVSKKEKWRRREIWNRVEDFRAITRIPISSPIVSLIVGSEEKALRASRHLLESGFHITAIRPPTVPANSCRLRITLTAAHTTHDLMKLAEALARCIDLQDISSHFSKPSARL